MGTYRGCGWGRGGSVRREGGAGQAERRGSAGAAGTLARRPLGAVVQTFERVAPSGHSSCPDFASLRERVLGE